MGDTVNQIMGPAAALLQFVNGSFSFVFDDVIYDPSGPLTLLDGVVGLAVPVVEGTVFLTKATTGAYTLAAPQAGPPTVVVTTSTSIQKGQTKVQSGQDGLEITIISKTAAAHVVQGVANGINGQASPVTLGKLTFGGAVGDSATLKALGGAWYTKCLNGVTVS